MLLKLQLFLRQFHPLTIGFVVIVLFLVFYRLYDPPRTFCQIQMQAVQERLADGFYQNKDRARYDQSVNAAFNFCLSTNSAGGCSDMFSRLDYFEKQVRTLPQECGADSATDPIRKALEKGMRLFVMIAWGDQPPANRYTTLSWLDTRDVGIYCRLQTQYQRLYGENLRKEFAASLLPALPESQSLKPRDMWERSLFAYPCNSLL